MQDLLNALLGSLSEPLTAALKMLIAAAVGWAILIFERKTGINISEAREAKVKRAAVTALLSFFTRLGVPISQASPEQYANAVEFARGHVTGGGSGDSIKRLKADAAAVRTMVEGQLAILRNALPPNSPR